MFRHIQCAVLRLRNTYSIERRDIGGLQFLDAHGDNFDYADLFEFTGKHGYSTTFVLRRDSEAYKLYGQSITGVIYYDVQTRNRLIATLPTEPPIRRLRIKLYKIGISQQLQTDLLWYGIDLKDIEYISVFLQKQPMEYEETGEKKVPNIVTIEVDGTEVDAAKMQHSYLVQKKNDGVALADFEREQLLAYSLVRDGGVNYDVLDSLGFDRQTWDDNINLWYHFYKIKSANDSLSEDDQKKYDDIQYILRVETFKKIIRELKKLGVSTKKSAEHTEIIREATKLALEFRPSVLLHGKSQIYWDIDTYIHVLMRHIKDYQIGAKKRTALLYKLDDLETLIEQVLRQVAEEYKHHLATKPNTPFYRKGNGAIEYNGDYYVVQISSDGRLEQFHML